VIAIIPAADRNKATVRVRVGLLEKDERVLPDMGVRVAFLDERAVDASKGPAPGGVLVPSDSVSSDVNGQFVYVVEGERADRRAVTIGEREGSRVRVLSGLERGERVVAQLSAELVAELTSSGRVSVLN
jgi:hypothetical protein